MRKVATGGRESRCAPRGVGDHAAADVEVEPYLLAPVHHKTARGQGDAGASRGQKRGEAPCESRQGVSCSSRSNVRAAEIKTPAVMEDPAKVLRRHTIGIYLADLC